MTRKIFRSSFLVGISVMLLSSILFFGVMHSNYETQAFEKLSVEAGCIAQGLELDGLDYFQELVLTDRITWIDPTGQVLFDSSANPDAMENHLQRQEVQQALASGSGESARYSQTLLERNYYYALLLSDGTILRLSCSASSIAAMLLMLLTPILWVVVLVLILCGVLAFRLAKQITKPINAIQLDNPEINPDYQELTPLIGRIQEQNRTIRKQMDELSLRQREFSAITENMREGFLLIDRKTAILSSNHSAMQLLGQTEEDAVVNLRQSHCSHEILNAVDTALSGEHAELLLTDEASTWQIMANPVVASGQVVGAVLLLTDVTEREQREALRREFSANVSHELKTPLTSISGFAELMKDGFVPLDKVKEFSSDIYRESRRLIDLVSDIINLSRLDEASGQFEQEPVDLYALCDEVLSSLQPVADKRSVSLTLEGEHLQVNGVWQILNEMVYNLCDNAIKYNVDGGSVTVSVRARAGSKVLSVRDTGIGIPYAQQGRVFERFYRVDKSHSKEIGGTGLGLSIVKHAAQYHGARMELISELGKGSNFSVIF